MRGDRKRVTCGISVCGALFMLASALVAAQDQVPPPAPKQDTVTIRAVNGTFELKGASLPDLFEFAERCESKPGYSESIVLLTLPLEIEAGPNDSLEHATTLLRDAVARGIEVSVEPSSEAGQVATFYWSGEPRFRGVIASVGVKYTMFLPNGIPVRATANVEVKQAGRLGFKGEGKEANKSASKKQPDCSSSQQ
jgi:hypothetical protein